MTKKSTTATAEARIQAISRQLSLSETSPAHEKCKAQFNCYYVFY